MSEHPWLVFWAIVIGLIIAHDIVVAICRTVYEIRKNQVNR